MLTLALFLAMIGAAGYAIPAPSRALALLRTAVALPAGLLVNGIGGQIGLLAVSVVLVAVGIRRAGAASAA